MEGQRRHVWQTSTGVGHRYQQPLPFHCKINTDVLLPPLLRHQSLVPVTAHYTVTSHQNYDGRPVVANPRNVTYSKAPPHWSTHFPNEQAQKLRDCRTVRMLSQPISEMQDRYRDPSTPQRPAVDYYSPLKALHGQQDPDRVLVAIGPTLSTAQADYRDFSRSELTPPSGLDALPTLSTLTKSGAYSRLPGHKAPPTMPPSLPRPSLPLPHAGKRSLYMDSFTEPARPPALSTLDASDGCAKWREGASKALLRDILEVPKMYCAESQTYGGTETVLV